MQKIVIFGGGSGSRGVTMALCQRRCEVTRVVPAWDSGGSSRELRKRLDMLAMGDIRQALMTMAHGEGRVSNVVRLFNARLSEASDAQRLRAEFDFYASGAHPLLRAMDAGIRGAILNYLRVFQHSVGIDFDFRRGSIGNFVLSGAYLAHSRDINTAIFVFRKLCAIDGNVWPSTIDDRVELSAHLRDGSVVDGQDRVTALGTREAAIGIGCVELISSDFGDPAHAAPVANTAVLDAIAQSDAIVFGPGSFFTSVVAHLRVEGITEAIQATATSVPKILIGNILECPETTNRTLKELVTAFHDVENSNVLTCVLANRHWVPFERIVNGFRYLNHGDLDPGQNAGIRIIFDDFEDPWTRGRHDATKVVETIYELMAG